MNYITTGLEKHKGYIVPIYINKEEELEKRNVERLRLILIRSGKGIISIDNRSVSFVAPALICLNAGEALQIVSEDLNFLEFYFHPVFLNPRHFMYQITPSDYLKEYEEGGIWLGAFLNREQAFNGILSIGQNTAKRIEKLILLAEQESKNQVDYNWPCRTRSFLLELLVVIEQLYMDDSKVNQMEILSDSSEMSEVIKFINNNFSEKITIADLTEHFCMNRTSLNENFKEATGYPIMMYLQNLRMQVAMIFLKDTKLSISEITERIGYNSSPHFIRMFKKHVGLTPSEYRQQYGF